MRDNFFLLGLMEGALASSLGLPVVSILGCDPAAGLAVAFAMTSAVLLASVLESVLGLLMHRNRPKGK